MLESILLIVFVVLITALIGMLPCWLLMVVQRIARLATHVEQSGHKNFAVVTGRQLKAH